MSGETCGAKKSGGGTCGKPAGWGTPNKTGRCRLHGGMTPTHLLAAERRMAAETAARYSVPREVHPVEGLLEQYHRYAGQVAWLEAKVNELPEEALFWGVESETDRRNPDEDVDGERLRTGAAAEFERKSKAGPNALLEQFDRVQREYAKLGVDIVRIGLETAGDALATRFASRLQVELDALMGECAALAAEQPGADLAVVFRARMVARIAAFAGARPVIEGVAA
ncbi:hypothetical protein [Dactylosporangium salmoneum]|uniref:Uncharacterized protein n=1 Tax=Dactylosporangium salmoneum TaxID=53361 RepID=A0ABP5TAQ2_9ACTN